MSLAERTYSTEDQSEQEAPVLYVVDSAAQIVRGFVGETDQDSHATNNDLQNEGALIAKKSGGALSPEYTELANQAYYDRLKRQREAYDPSKIRKALREERLRRTDTNA